MAVKSLNMAVKSFNMAVIWPYSRFPSDVPHRNKMVSRRFCDLFRGEAPKIFEILLRQFASRNESDDKGKYMLLGGEAPENFINIK